MSQTYAAMTTLIREKLQASATADFSVAEINSQIEESLKEVSTYRPHLLDVVFKIEGRYGNATATSADNIVDATKGHFVAADTASETEKVVHNITDSTRAVILGGTAGSFTSTAQVGIAPDIMAINEHYEIYNKQCWNHRQVYIGDVPEYENVHSVEYPIGTRRNFRLYDRVLEMDINSIPDTNTNTAKVTNLPDENALIRFNMPHQLSQLTDVSAVVASSALSAATIISGSAFQLAGTIEVGSEFNVENHRTTYVINAETTIASNTATFSFYPPLEAVADTATVLTFRKSSLEPNVEEAFAELAAARLMINKAPKFFNAISLGGGVVYQNFLNTGERRLSEILGKLRKAPPKIKETHSRD
ncbi:hypothetical protein LCGC14_1444870 [marine sediment metagenome]|uniref:Uncharacterized protein n=1 Tax=marine sediment metagenome TaxID=412755 RepID=A0A0F9MLF9_9ZZZZ